MTTIAIIWAALLVVAAVAFRMRRARRKRMIKEAMAKQPLRMISPIWFAVLDADSEEFKVLKAQWDSNHKRLLGGDE